MTRRETVVEALERWVDSRHIRQQMAEAVLSALNLSDGWQDIETAPKWSGTGIPPYVLISDGTYVFVGYRSDPNYPDDPEWCEARGLVMEANNSLYGSQGYFHSLNGGAYDKYHLSHGIEQLKSLATKRYVALQAAEAEVASLTAQVAKLEGKVEEALQVVGWYADHARYTVDVGVCLKDHGPYYSVIPDRGQRARSFLASLHPQVPDKQKERTP